MKTLGIINCCKKKVGKGYAIDVYQGTLFKLLLKYVSLKCNNIKILSSKYGLIDLQTIIELYDVVFFKQYIAKNTNTIVLSSKEKKEWAQKVYNDLQNEIKKYDELHFYINIYFMQYLKPILDKNKVNYKWFKFEGCLGKNISKYQKLLEKENDKH